MIRCFSFVCVLAVASLVLAQDAPQKPQVDLSTTQLKASYAIGVSIGRSLKNDGMEVDVATLAAGLKASLQGTKPQIPFGELNEAITAFQQEMQAKMLARREALGKKNQAEGPAFLKANAKKDGIVTLPSGLQYQVLKKGNGKQPTKSDRVKAHYHGTLIDGTVFDSSLEGEPFSTAVTRVIPGWTEALLAMHVGDKWRLFVPSKLAYGERGAGSDIGPHATLIFEMELLEIE